MKKSLLILTWILLTLTSSLSYGDSIHPPIANPGGPYFITAGDTLTLNGGGSYDPDAIYGDSITCYLWYLDYVNGDSV